MILFCAAQRRECHPRATFLIHDSHFSDGGSGRLDDLRIAETADQRVAEAMALALALALALAMAVDAEDLRALMSRECRFDRAAELEGLAVIVDREAEAVALRQRFEAIKAEEAQRLLKRREELRHRDVPAFGCLRGEEQHQPTNTWVVLDNGKMHFDADRLAAVRPKQETSPPVRSITPEQATQRYLASLSADDRGTFERCLEE